MRGFRIEFVRRPRRPATWILLVLSACFFIWSWNRFEDRSEATRLAVAAAIKPPPTADDPREAQEQADAVSRREALAYPWPGILGELEAFADQDTTVLRFEHTRNDGSTRVTIQTKDFTSLEHALARVRRVAHAGRQWRIASTSRDTTDAAHSLHAELIATKIASSESRATK